MSIHLRTKPTRSKAKLDWVLLIVTAPILLYLLFWGIGGFLVVGDSIQKADAVVLLSGGDDARLGEAVQVYQSGLAELLLITETGNIPDGGGPRASTLSGQRAVSAGVAEEDIYTTLGKSASTHNEAAAVLGFCQHERLKTIIVVTDPYHTRRTQVIFRSIFAGSGIDVLVRPVRDHWYQSSTWFFSLRGWKTTLTEYVKLTALLFGIQGD